jgi:phytoene dehydrogenase-like protein
MSNTSDAVIIGAGHNSLACACHLAQRGWHVAVYEQAAVPGGTVKTGEYTLPGFRHDWAAMNLSLFAGSAFHSENAQELAKHGLAFAPTAHPFASVFPDGRWFGVSSDPALTAARVRGFSPVDAAAWVKLTDSFPDDAESIFAVLGSPMNLRAFTSLGWKTLRKRGTAGTLDLAQFLLKSPRAWLDQTFESDHIKATLAAWGMHLDFAPDCDPRDGVPDKGPRRNCNL